MIEFAVGSRFQMMGRFLIDGKPLDVSQWLGVSVTLADYSTNTIFATLNTAPVDPENGVYQVWADDTSQWPIGRARMDCSVIDGNNNTYNAAPDYLRIIDSLMNSKKAVSPT